MSEVERLALIETISRYAIDLLEESGRIYDSFWADNYRLMAEYLIQEIGQLAHVEETTGSADFLDAKKLSH